MDHIGYRRRFVQKMQKPAFFSFTGNSVPWKKSALLQAERISGRFFCRKRSRFGLSKCPKDGGYNERSPYRLDQHRAPIHEALEKFRQMRVVPFDVPGHKRGRGNPELTSFLGQQCVGVDVNSMKPLDNLCHPGFRDSGGRKAGSRCIRRSTCLFNGRRNYKLGAKHGSDCL